MNRVSPLSTLSVLLLGLTMLAPLSIAAGESQPCAATFDTSAPFEDYCYHQGVWYSPDTANFDVVIVPPASPYELRDIQLVRESVDMWEAGIKALGAPWIQSGLQIDSYMLGMEPVPNEALADPEVVVLLTTEFNPQVLFGVAVLPPVTICHGQNVPTSWSQMPGFHQHPGSPVGSYLAACEEGGIQCVVANTSFLWLPDDDDRQWMFDLISHEVGHCLTLGHVGDANTESTDDSLAYPHHDIMSYENDGIRATRTHCPSNLNARTVERAFATLLGQPGTTQVAPHPAGYSHMRPADWHEHACPASTAAFDDTDVLFEIDPLGLNAEPDSDGDGVGDSQDTCPGFDDRFDADGDGIADGCDDDDNDGPLGDLDGDGVRNADDLCPGIDDASPECIGPGASTFYFGRGSFGSPSGNLDYVWGSDESFLVNTLVMDPTVPDFPDPAVILAPGLDDAAAHNGEFEPAEWSSSEPVSLSNQDVEVIWWGMEPITGGAFLEQWDVTLYFNGAATHSGTARIEATGLLDGVVPTEYKATIPGVTGTGTLSVVIDPAAFTNQQDFLIFYDGVDYPSRLVVSGEPKLDSDGDGVTDDLDECPGFNDALDLDGDGIPDGCDADRDGDGVANAADTFPDDASESADTDADGVGDNSDACAGFDDDLDADGDGTPDGCEVPAGITITSPAEGAVIDGSAPLTVTGTYTPASEDDTCTDCNGDGFVVVAVVDTGINPYNPDFAATSAQPTGHPSTYIDGFPATAGDLVLRCTATTAISTACASDFAQVAQNTLYTIPGTKIIGAISTDKAGVDFAPTPILDNNGHGTGSASVAVGNQMGTCPECLLVVVEGFNVDWAYRQPWIDIVSNSWGRRANAGAAVMEADDFVFGSGSELDRTRAFTENGGTSLWAAGNGAENAFVVPISTYTAPYTGADWHFVVGAVTTGNGGADSAQDGEQSILASGKPVIVSSYGSGTIPASCFNTLTLACSHSGTSAATPITAGAMASVLAKAKQLLGSANEGPEGSGIAAKGSPVAGNQYLQDGELSRQELWSLVSKTARDQDSGWLTVPVSTGQTDTPIDHAATGYGIVNRWSRDTAIAVLETGADLPDRSDVDAFMADDSEIRQTLWGGWAEPRFASANTASRSDGDDPASIAPEVARVLGQVVAMLDPFVHTTSEPVDDGTIPGVWGEIGDVTVSNTDTHVEVRLDLAGELDGAPTVLGNPFTYQVTLTAPHNVAGQTYRATYTFDAVTTGGGVLVDSFAFNVLTTVDAQGLASVCPVATDLSGSHYDLETFEAVWVIPFSAFDHDSRATRAQGCTAFTRNGDDLAAGDVLSGILGESTVKVATVSVGGLGDSATAPDYVVQGGEGPACEEGDHILVALGAATACRPFDPAEPASWSVALVTGLAPGLYAVTATAYADGVAIGATLVNVTVPIPDTDGDGLVDDADNCPLVANAGQADLDGDAVGDACDSDRDGDGVANDGDAFPDDPSESADADSDGVGDNADRCAGHDDAADLDGDGTADGCDVDMDGDGYSNTQEIEQGTDPADAGSKPNNRWTMSECDTYRSRNPNSANAPPQCRFD